MPAVSSRASSAASVLQLGIRRVDLGERDDAGRHVQQPADVEVLARLRHHRLVGRDDQHDEIDPAGARPACS